MLNVGLDEAQAGIKIARTNINNLRYNTVMLEKDRMISVCFQGKPFNITVI